MRFAFISGGSTLWAWQRLQAEGHQVGVFQCDPLDSDVGSGFVDLFPSVPALTKWGGGSAIYICDITSMPTFSIKIGKTADSLRKAGMKVLFGGAMADRLEDDRDFGQAVAKHCGFAIPESKPFSNIDQALDFLVDRDEEERWYFKSDKYIDAMATYGAESVSGLIRHLEYTSDKHGDNIPCHLERRIEGVPVSTAGWFNGSTFARPLLGTIEHKKLLNDDLGPHTGCSLNMVCTHTTDLFTRLYFDKFEKWLVEQKMPAGLYDVNAILSDDKAYFLEWTPRIGYDSEPTGSQLVPDLGQFFLELSAGTLTNLPYRTDRGAFGVRLTVPPYPAEHVTDKGDATGVPVFGISRPVDERFAPYGLSTTPEGDVYVSDKDGAVGVSICTGTDVFDMNRKCVAQAKELEVPNLQYRTDGGKMVAKDIEALKTVGIEIPYGS